MSRAPGYFLTWHTYGTWLHGDDGGSVDRKHNTFGEQRLAPDRARYARAQRAMKDPPLVLPRIAKLLVDAAMREHCRRRAWRLGALAVRSNHVHVVIVEPDVKPELIVQQLKQWGTRRLRAHRIIGPRQLAWAAHASTRYLFEHGSVEETIEYVLTMQDNPPPGHGRRESRNEA